MLGTEPVEGPVVAAQCIVGVRHEAAAGAEGHDHRARGKEVPAQRVQVRLVERGDRVAVEAFADVARYQARELGLVGRGDVGKRQQVRSEEHTSELQSLMRISYAVFCLKKKTTQIHTYIHQLKSQTSKNSVITSS